MPLRSKYEALVANGVLTSDELELAQRSARRKNLHLETILVDEFQVSVPDLGAALATYFNVAYEPFRADRVRPGDLLRNMSREFCETNQWLPVGEDAEGIAHHDGRSRADEGLADGRERVSEEPDRL